MSKSKDTKQPEVSAGYKVNQQPVEVAGQAPAAERKCSLHNRMNYPQEVSVGQGEMEVLVVPPNGILRGVNRDSIIGDLPDGVVMGQLGQ
ncbi:hypothetical protein GR11A_00078 [Vibrio phage vB_VcorM_GR11A]|nr:hypothetical protein GR11A_00078 [Vibrio phage vB_VcorM_GR11A]